MHARGAPSCSGDSSRPQLSFLGPTLQLYWCPTCSYRRGVSPSPGGLQGGARKPRSWTCASRLLGPLSRPGERPQQICICDFVIFFLKRAPRVYKHTQT